MTTKKNPTKKKRRPRPVNSKKPWSHVGGGCALFGNERHPCDDEYEHARTKERLSVTTTQARHFAMPLRLASVADLKRLDGIGTIKRRKPRT